MSKRVSDEELVTAILNTQNQKEASQLLGISEQTICNRLQSEAVQELLYAHRKALFDATSNRIVSISSRALETLVELLESDSENIRLNTACKLLSLSQDYISKQDIVSRLEHLEETLFNQEQL